MKVAFFRGLRYVSFFNYGYEALVVNELGRSFRAMIQNRGTGDDNRRDHPLVVCQALAVMRSCINQQFTHNCLIFLSYRLFP